MDSVIDLSNVSPQQSVLVSYPKRPAATSTLYLTAFSTTDAGGTANHTVVGVEVVLKKGDPNGLWDRLHVDRQAQKLDPSNPRVATSSLLIACDTLTIHGEFSLPEAKVTVFARRIVWATNDAAIVVTPLLWAVEKADNATISADGHNGADGRKAGSLTVFAAEAAPGAVKRLRAEGGRGQDPGTGLDGENGSVMAEWWSRTYTAGNYPKISTGTPKFDPPAVYIDYEWLWVVAQIDSGINGVNGFPTDGTDARPAGRPGCGGDGGALTTNLASLAATLVNNGGSPGTRGREHVGGAAGEPRNSAKYKVKLWFDLMGTSDAKTEVNRTGDSHTSKAGVGKPAPAALSGTGATPVPTVTQIANAWLHPLGVQRTLAYARDLMLAEARDDALTLLLAYDKALAARTPDNKAWAEQDEALWTAAQSEVASMIQRLLAHLDYFGNAAGYTPLLSLPGMMELYKTETARALKIQLLVEWITIKERDAKALAAALATTIDNLNEDTKAAAERIVGAEAAMAKLMGDIDALEKELGNLSTQLETLRTQLLAKARNDLEAQARVKFAIHIAAAICQMIPVGQPALGVIGSLASVAAEFVGDDGTKAPDTVSKMGDLISKAREAATKADEAKQKAEKEKSKEKPADDKAAKTEASAWAKAGDGLGPALTEVSAGLKALQVPKTEVEAQLQRLESEDKEWGKLVDAITDLNQRKARLFESLADAMQSLGEAYGRVSSNAAALISLQGARGAAIARLDSTATGFVKEMGQRSRLTLLKYLYLLVRAYETTVARPIDVDWQLGAITEKINALVAPEKGFDAATLDQHVKLLTPLFESNLDIVRNKLLADFPVGALTATLRLAFDQKQTPAALAALNGLGETVIDPLRVGLILPDRQLARLSGIVLKKLAFDPDGPVLPSTYNMAIYLRPARRGTLRREAGLFAVYSDNPIGWSWTYLGRNDVRPSKPSAAAEDVLDLILGKGGKDIRQKVALPPVWSDLTLSVLISPPLPAARRPRISELQFELACDQDDAPVNQAVLVVQSLGDVPAAVVDGSPDLAGRKAGLNQMLRVYAKGARVRLTVPAAVGGAVFESWDLLGNRVERTGIQDRSVEFQMDDHVLARCHWSIDGERVTHVTIEHDLPMAEIQQIIDAGDEAALSKVVRIVSVPPLPVSARLLRTEPDAGAWVTGLVPAGIEPTILETGANGWRLAQYGEVSGWLAPIVPGS